MPVDRAKAVKKAFDTIGPKNPLRELGEMDKHLLWSLLTIYMFESQERVNPEFSLALEEMGKIAADAVALAKRIQREVVNSESWEVLKPFLRKVEDAPARLYLFGSRLGGLMNAFGKPGHKNGVFVKSSLVKASEFVKLRTGDYNDEHLAELCQEVNPEFSGRRKRVSEVPEFSGEAIRKQRVHFAKTYPLFYKQVLKSLPPTPFPRFATPSPSFLAALSSAFEGSAPTSEGVASPTGEEQIGPKNVASKTKAKSGGVPDRDARPLHSKRSKP
jgi:hypothetical protein